jgi:hypothetical protein
MSNEGARQIRRARRLRLLRLTLMAMSYGVLPYFTPVHIPLYDLDVEPQDHPLREPACILSRRERRSWAEIEAYYR